MRQLDPHQMELSSISLSILQWRGTWPFTTKLPQKRIWTLWWWTLQALWYRRRRRWESKWGMLKTPGKRRVLISLNKNRFFFMPHFLLYHFFFHIQVPFLFWILLLLIQTFLLYSSMSIFTLLPIWPSRRTVSHIHYPPPILTKYHTWYFINTNFFISIHGILFGLHHAYFSQSCYFQSIMDVAKPEWPVPKGSQALHPILFNDLNQLSFTHFLSFFYCPNNFAGTKRDWENIQDYCIDWYLPEHMAIMTWKLIEIWYNSFTYTERQALQWVNLSYKMINWQRQYWWWLHRQENETLVESNENTFVKDDSI